MLKIFIAAVIAANICLSFACNDNNENMDTTSMKRISQTHLTINEPSGITFNGDYSGFWIVEGKKGRIIKTTKAGEPIETLIYKGEDIEGIYYDSTDSTLWITEERSRYLVQLTVSGIVLRKISVQIEGPENKGLEGITRDAEGNFWVVNENFPVSVLKLDGQGAIVQTYTIDFAADLSDIAVIPSGNEFYLLSDESSAFYHWSPAEGMIAKYTLPSIKYEGIAYNPHDKTITVVNDDNQIMEVYK